MTIPSIGPLTATALVAAVSDASAFKNGRQFAAWLGLCHANIPRGEGTLARHQQTRRELSAPAPRAWGADHDPLGVGRTTDRRSQWMRQLVERRGTNRTAVAVANKKARMGSGAGDEPPGF